MAVTAPPIKTTFEDIEVIVAFLRNQVGWTSIDEMRKVIPSRHGDSRKIEAMRYLGLLERDGANIKLSGPGRDYATTPERRVEVLRSQLRAAPLYHYTLSWIYHGKRESV